MKHKWNKLGTAEIKVIREPDVEDALDVDFKLGDDITAMKSKCEHCMMTKYDTGATNGKDNWIFGYYVTRKGATETDRRKLHCV